jgi:hypothetical protein
VRLHAATAVSMHPAVNFHLVLLWHRPGIRDAVSSWHWHLQLSCLLLELTHVCLVVDEAHITLACQRSSVYIGANLQAQG